jgi:hypothetical protein
LFECKVQEERVVYKKLNSTGTLIQRTTTDAQGHMYYIGPAKLDVHKKTNSYCAKDASGQDHREGQIGATRWELDGLEARILPAGSMIICFRTRRSEGGASFDVARHRCGQEEE